MFLTGLIFFLALLLSLAVILLVTRPTAAERAIEGRIIHLRNFQTGAALLKEETAGILKHIRLSDLPWLDNVLRRWELTHQIHLLIQQAESSWSVTGVLVGSGLLAAGGFAMGCYELSSVAIALLPALALGVLPFLLLRWQRSRRLREFNRHLPEAIDLMSRALRAGHSLTAAIEIVGEESPEPVRTEFREVYRQQNFGLPAREALVQLARRIPLPELNFVVTAMLLQKETGGNLVEVLERTTSVIRERLRIQGEIRIYTAQGRLTGWILSLLPVAMFFLLTLANRGYTRVLVEDPTGRRLIYTGLTLMVVGGLFIRKIVNVKV